MNQVFDYINMDDDFNNDKEGPRFGSSALQKKSASNDRDRSPVIDREKFKAPELKKHSELRKGGLFEGEEEEPEETLPETSGRKRTFTFSKANESPDKQEEDQQSAADIQSRKEQIK